MTRLLGKPPKTLEERYFSEIRPEFYKIHGSHHQHGVRKGTTLAQHFDSACQFVLTVSRIAEIPDDKRAVLLAATAVHDLNKLDDKGRNVKTLARNREFLEQEFDRVGVSSLIKNDEDLELARKLIERHSGHNASDGALFLPEDPMIRRIAAILIAADLFDLGIAEKERFRKIENELTVAFGRPSKLFKVSVSQDRGYITALLLGACEEVLAEKGLTTLSIFPDHILFEGRTFPTGDMTGEIAARWQTKISNILGNNIEQLVKPANNGIKISNHAIQYDSNEIISIVLAQLEKKKATFKPLKVLAEIKKHGEGKATSEAMSKAAKLGLVPIENSEEFALSEGLKSAYISYRKVTPEISPQKVWDLIGNHIGLSEEQKQALEVFDEQYGRSLFAVKQVKGGMNSIIAALKESLEMRKGGSQDDEESQEISEELVEGVKRGISLQKSFLDGIEELNSYIDARPTQRCSLGATYGETSKLNKPEMPVGTKVQMFSNRLPGGMSGDPSRQAESLVAQAYLLLKVGANLPASDPKESPFYLHFSLPHKSCPELLRIWKEWLMSQIATNGEFGTITVDTLKLYKDNVMEFQPNKVVGFAFPKRTEFVYSNVVIPITWGDANSSLSLLKSLRLVLELSLAPDFGFPFILSSDMQVEVLHDEFGRVEGIPTALSNLLGSGNYNYEEALKIRDCLRYLGKLAIEVSSLSKTDDCLYDLARATTEPFSLYYVLLRWILREHGDNNLDVIWIRIREPLSLLLESLMPDENAKLTLYLKEAAKLAAEHSLRGRSFNRSSIVKPFTDFLKDVRSYKEYMDLDFLFASLSQKFHNHLDRIWEYKVGETKLNQITEYYSILRKLYEEIYNSRPEKLLNDREDITAAYLFFWQEAYQVVKARKEAEAEKKKADAHKNSDPDQSDI